MRPSATTTTAGKDRRERCGRCGARAAGYDRGGGRRRWRHVDVGFARCVLE
ncbi:MAG: transposase family protein, partial [Acidimicrobiia bacterium]|nr:transposase family protein [Acidimicrobiia bacterium]